MTKLIYNCYSFTNNFNSSFQVYRDLWKASNTKDLSGFIVRDLTVCCEEDPRVLCWLLPHLYQAFPKHTTGNPDLVHLVLQRLDANQLHDLVCLVLQGALTMFDNSSFANILGKLQLLHTCRCAEYVAGMVNTCQ